VAKFCVDASLVLAWLLPEQRTLQVSRMWLQLLQEGHALVSPPLLLAECTSVLREQAYKGRIAHRDSAAILRDLLSLPIGLVASTELYPVALDIAARLKQPKAYDAQYIAAAQLSEGELLTLDNALYQGATRVNTRSRLVTS
jgi:predicted nucleic acid-binding protein